MFPITLPQLVIIPFCLFLPFYFWEYAYVHDPYAVKPSTLITNLVVRSRTIFEWLGNRLAWVSSFLDWLDLKDMIKAFKNLCEPMIDLCITPLYTVKGYIDQLNIYDHPYMVFVGTLILATSLWYFVSWIMKKWNNNS